MINKNNHSTETVSSKSMEIDYRNCKYQGDVKYIDDNGSTVPHGYGIVLD